MHHRNFNRNLTGFHRLRAEPSGILSFEACQHDFTLPELRLLLLCNLGKHIYHFLWKMKWVVPFHTYLLLISCELTTHILKSVMNVEDTVIQAACIIRIDDIVKGFFTSSAITEIHLFCIEQSIDFRKQFYSLQVNEVSLLSQPIRTSGSMARNRVSDFMPQR